MCKVHAAGWCIRHGHASSMQQCVAALAIYAHTKRYSFAELDAARKLVSPPCISSRAFADSSALHVPAGSDPAVPVTCRMVHVALTRLVG